MDLLACRDGHCGRACANDRDCPPDAMCAERDGSQLCEVPEGGDRCVYDSDCAEPYLCDHDQVCRFECIETWDCDYPRVCEGNLCVLPDAGT